MSIERTGQEKAVRYAFILKERFEARGILRELARYPNFIVWRYDIVHVFLSFGAFLFQRRAIFFLTKTVKGLATQERRAYAD